MVQHRATVIAKKPDTLECVDGMLYREFGEVIWYIREGNYMTNP